MSMQMHVAKVHKVEYGKAAMSEMTKAVTNGVICEMCETAWHDGGDDGSRYAERLQVPVEEFEKMIADLKAMSDEDFKAMCDDFAEYEDVTVEKEEFTKAMKRLYDGRDKKNTYVHLLWY